MVKLLSWTRLRDAIFRKAWVRSGVFEVVCRRNFFHTLVLYKLFESL